MSYAVKNDLSGIRAVDSESDVQADEYFSAEFVEPVPVPVVPERVTMRQARLALHAAGLLAQVEAAIDAMPEPPRTAVRIEWDYSSEVHRNKPFVLQLGAALGLDSADMDSLFVTASPL